MKRKRFRNPVSAFFALWWSACSACGHDFILERGWYLVTGSYHGGRGHIRCLCRSCAPTREAALRIFTEQTLIDRLQIPIVLRSGIYRPSKDAN